ncbi:MAG: QueT transporter family protein [Candidatus Methanomethylicaceae archaeon]|nr:QueT transporter family protein [Candidatus Verstraetearchaeota archaeon]
MNFKTEEISLIAIFATLYAVAVISLAPISFGIWQIRIADMLLPLSIIFGMPCTIGLSLGCLIANIYGGLGIIDILGGTIANFLACHIAYKIGKRNGIVIRFLSTITQTFIITIIVGVYLSFLFNVPIIFSIIGVLVGSIISINIFGFILEETIRKMPLKILRK